MVQDPHCCEARLHLISTTFQHFAGISYQFGSPGPEYWHELTEHDHRQPPFADDIVPKVVADLQTLVTNIHNVSRKFGFTINQIALMTSKEGLPMGGMLKLTTI